MRLPNSATLAAWVLAAATGCGDDTDSHGNGGGGGDVSQPTPCDGAEDCDRGCIPDLAKTTGEGTCAFDCPDALLLDEDAVCGAHCGPSNEALCLPGWACYDSSSLENTCVCSPHAEACDGFDNDCNGFVDDYDPADAACAAELGEGYRCNRGQCEACADRCGDACTSTLTDPAHCGACDAPCTAGASGVAACVEGSCAEVELIVAPQTVYDRLVDDFDVDGDTLVWAFGDSSAPAAEGCSMGDCEASRFEIEPEYAVVGGIFADSGEIWFIEGLDVRSCEAAACTSSVMATLPVSPSFIVGDATQLFFGTYTNTSTIKDTVHSCDRSDCAGTLEQVFLQGDDMTGIGAISVDATTLYIHLSGYFQEEGRLLACPRSGCVSPTNPVPDAGFARAVASSAEGTAFTANYGDEFIYYVPAGEAEATLLGQAHGWYLDGLAVDGTNVYVQGTRAGSEYIESIGYCALSGCPASGPIVLVDVGNEARSLFVENGHVYWIGGPASDDEGAPIYRVLAPGG